MNPGHTRGVEDGANPFTDPLNRDRFPADPWRLTETWPTTADLPLTETLFAVGNGYLGMRDNPPEGRDAHTHGTYINGFHETWPIRHAESAYGFATTGQTMVNVPDSKLMKLYVDDEPLLLSVADLEHYERSLDFRDGVLRRNLIWRTPAGQRVMVESTRMISLDQRHLAVMTLKVTMLDGDAPVAVSSQILNRQDGVDEYHVAAAAMGEGTDPRKGARLHTRVLEPRGDWASGRRMILGYQCASSRMTLAVGADHHIETENEFEELISTEPDLGKKVYRIHATAGRPITITKAVAYHSSRGVPVRELFDRCRRTLDRFRADGAQVSRDAQRAWLDRFWADADVEVESDGGPEGDSDATQQAIRWNLFQLAQASARADQLGVPAKGVTGSGYEGHYFWDTEVYVIPFLSYTCPGLARNALRFRVNQLDKARERARELAQRGALYPWRTINGEEASAYYAAGTAQYHIDADIAFAVSRYVDTTGDVAFMRVNGIDILVETARMWEDLGFWRENEHRVFNIHGVTGPDEYTTVVNNNLFTNVMARYNLERAAAAVRTLRQSDTAAYERMVHRLDLDPAEPGRWLDCAAHMTIPYDEELGIHPQDEHFLDRELWDLPATPEDRRPLLLHYHPLVIYRFQVLKQADVVLAMFLQGHRFTEAQKKANFDYYDPITTGDSTLSAVVQSIIAAEVGYERSALDYFLHGLYVDLADLHRNTVDGVHIASAGGVWNCLVYGFGGMMDLRVGLGFDPRLPESWSKLTFRIRRVGVRMRVEVEQEQLTISIEEGAGPVDLTVRGEQLQVTEDVPLVVALNGQGPRHGRGPRTPVLGGTREDGSVITAALPTDTAPLEQIRPNERPTPERA
ncbi:glycoside hydrolase family 65 protein [Tersicoccus sp. Bi-70]|uniref:glycoside hydrolase family 65 protein n=1 Tax=Tersicoccus sp. Bi-70 TaxID=1897634 RepID=UPI000978A762|nr:glycosyl hydrolase family 65 protein [Tersicoccus sp. Bi-70]OMH34178.1 kojibiose phosphorylase [Tersicoccus sp. Bi-70]